MEWLSHSAIDAFHRQAIGKHNQTCKLVTTIPREYDLHTKVVYTDTEMIQCIAMHENLENWCIDLTYRYKTFKYLNLHKTFLIDNMSLQNIFICQFRFSQNTFIRTFTN